MSGLGSRLLRIARWLDRAFRARSERSERVLLMVAIALFALVLIGSLLHLPDLTDVRWALLFLAGLVGTPGAMLFLALEYQIGGRAIGLRLSFIESLRTSVLSAAANLLPVPGSVLVRTRGLRQAGSSYRQALTVLAAIGLLWVGTAALFASGFLFGPRLVVGIVLLGLGILLIAGGYALVRMSSGSSSSFGLTFRIVAVELGGVIVGVIRTLLTVRGLGFPISVAQAAALHFAGVVATSTGIFPGGLGIRELFSGIISPFVGLPAAVGVVSAAAGRILQKLFLLPISIGILRWPHRRGEPVSTKPVLTPREDI